MDASVLARTSFFLSTIPMGGEATSSTSTASATTSKYQFVKRNTASDEASASASSGTSAFERVWLEKGLEKGRLFFSSSRCYPAGVFSMLPFAEMSHARQRAQQRAESNELGGISAQLKGGARSGVKRNWRKVCGVGGAEDEGSSSEGEDAARRAVEDGQTEAAISYERHLHSERAPCLLCVWAQRNGRVAHPPPPPWYPYDANELDDPGIRGNLSNLDHTILSLPSYRMSVVPHEDRRELKTQLNEQWKVTHPNLAHMHASRRQKGYGRKVLTLSKIRRLKRETCALASRPDLDVELSTIALAHCYFEKLVFAKRVSAANRRVVMATCVLLAHKFNHTSLPDSAKTLTKQRDLLDALESYPKGAPRAKILTAEPDVLSALRFALHVPRKDVMYVLTSLQRVSLRRVHAMPSFRVAHVPSTYRRSRTPLLSTYHAEGPTSIGCST